jgi:hypothetical protein
MSSEDLLTKEEKKELATRLKNVKEDIIKSIIIHRHDKEAKW